MTPAKRAAFSLIEVLLATSILAGSLIVLEELARLGRRHAVAAEEAALAQSLARARLNELLAGVRPLKSVETAPLADAPEWVCAVGVEPLGASGLNQITVTVAKAEPSSGGTPAIAQAQRSQDGAVGNAIIRNRRAFSLTQWVRSGNASPPFGSPGDRSPIDSSPNGPSRDGTRHFAARVRQ